MVDDTPLLSTERPLTRARWWVLLVYCLLAVCQAITWNVFSPIFPATFLAMPSWSSSFLSWVINTANISFGLTLVPVSLAVKRFGPRRITLFCALMVTTCSAVRCLPLRDGPAQRALHVFSMVCNGAGGAWLNFGAPIISELWFPSSERTLATSVMTVSTYAGGALGFLVGPAIVGEVATHAAAQAGVRRLFYVEAAFCAVCGLMCAAYFPDRPPHAPSEAAAAKRSAAGGAVNDAPAVRGSALRPYFACKRRAAKYWVVSLAMALPLGVSQGWGSVLYETLRPLGFSEAEAAWLGFAQTMAGCAASVFVGALLDRFAGRLKLVTTCFSAVAALSYFAFCAAAAGYLPVAGSVAFAFTVCVAGGTAFNICVPLLFELIMESTYGWGDEGTGAMLTVLANTLVQIAFLVVNAAGGEAGLWTAWATAASMGACAIAVLLLQVEYRRLAVDRATEVAATGCAFDRWGWY